MWGECVECVGRRRERVSKTGLEQEPKKKAREAPVMTHHAVHEDGGKRGGRPAPLGVGEAGE